jgi:hypothetical protein
MERTPKPCGTAAFFEMIPEDKRDFAVSPPKDGKPGISGRRALPKTRPN